ncbi:hypothetical protein FRX31_019392 [Thalictrum thalictroides]|uniref:Uncharacterized protein n=1 Tax=Thalictrum thalictroides TaxID=46969 RepID=A0A7J6W3D0_THATH|nr:hypothetical protein FRX31_019392 [Thalictrum thalictroides]
MSKIDRCLVNCNWTNAFVTQVEFLPHDISDHSPIMLTWYDNERKTYPFRFNNAWVGLPGFKEMVAEIWNNPVYANPIQVLMIKEKALKSKIKEWAKANCTKLHEKVQLALEQLEETTTQSNRY